MARLRTPQRTSIVIAATLGLVLGAAACSSDDGTSTSTEATGTPEAEPADTEPTQAEEQPADDAGQQLSDMLPERIREAGTITVANPLQNPPYAFLEADGETLSGIAPDLSEALEPMLGVEFDWVDTPFPNLIPGLEAGEFDMIWGSITDNLEREEILDFVDYHMDGALLLVESGNPREVDTLEDSCGLSIGALSGSFQIELLENQSATCEEAGEEPIDVRVYPDVPGGLTAVRSGQAAAFFAGVGAARYQAEVAPDEFDTAGPIYSASPFGAAFRKDDRELTETIQAGLQQLVEDGSYIEVLDRYGMGLTALEADQILINGAEQLNQEILEVPDSP